MAPDALELRPILLASGGPLVSLLEDDEAAQLALVRERRAAEDQGISFVSFPIPDRSVPASTEAAVAVIDASQRNLKRERTLPSTVVKALVDPA